MSEAPSRPTALHRWAERQISGTARARDASHPRDNSRVWELVRADGRRFFLKVSATARSYERETFALRHAAPALGGGRAPQLHASSAEHLALLTAALPGRPANELLLTAAEEYEAHRQAGLLLARLHTAGDLTGHWRTEAEGALHTAEQEADRHVEAAGHRLTPEQRTLVRHLTDRLRQVGPLHLGFIHGNATPANLLWSGHAAWIGFARSRFAPVVQDFVALACGAWADRPRLRTAFLGGYGRELTPEEQHVLTCLAGLDAVRALTPRAAHDDPDAAERGHRTLHRLMTGVLA
ncbi:phosphotransferase enzyme family protein [Streptomyces sp. NPDC018036]|uniref:phosphotransferase enzyme family protein n=1 Tax=Streptomyces sp. NPDC018036 TaxID=3365035 RepID=UPI0037B7921E